METKRIQVPFTTIFSHERGTITTCSPFGRTVSQYCWTSNQTEADPIIRTSNHTETDPIMWAHCAALDNHIAKKAPGFKEVDRLVLDTVPHPDQFGFTFVLTLEEIL